MTSTATAATKALRKIWAAPITLRTTQNERGDLEVTVGRGVRMQAAGAAQTISNALGVDWEFVSITDLRGASSNIRITYRRAAQQTQAQADETTDDAWISLPSRDDKPRSRRYLHLETGVEVERNSIGWQVGICGKPGPKAHAGVSSVGQHFEYKTMTAAIEAAETHVIPRVRQIIAEAHTAALWEQTGTPEQWTEGQADEKTVAARRTAIERAGRRTGRTAKCDEFVKHVETGAIGTWSSYSKTTAGQVWVYFPGKPTSTLVDYDDVVVLEGWFTCNRIDLATHDQHGEAVAAECLTPLPDADLEGPELIEIRPGRWEATDGISVLRDSADGTYWAHDDRGIPGVVGTHRDRMICSSQRTLGRTYRWINERRAAIAQHYATTYEIAADVDAARATVAQMRAAVAAAKAAWADAFDAGRPGNYERKIEARARMGLARAELILARLFGDHRERLVTIEASDDEGATWEMFGSSARRINYEETASAQALRYAIEERYAGPDRWRSEAGPLRVHVYTDPYSLVPDGEWANFTDPCPPGEHDNDGNHTRSVGARTDGSKVETSRCAGCGHAMWRVRPFVKAEKPTVWTLEGDPLPEPEPGVICLPVECLRTEHYGMIAVAAEGGVQQIESVGPVDPDTGTVPLYVRSLREPLCVFAGTKLQLRRQGDDGPGLDGPDPDPSPDPDRSGPTVAESILASLGPDRRRFMGPVPLGYRVRTQTGGAWRIVQTGTIPAIFPGVRTGLDEAAETILGNARPILGLGPKTPMPPVIVQTWDRQSGLTSSAALD